MRALKPSSGSMVYLQVLNKVLLLIHSFRQQNVFICLLLPNSYFHLMEKPKAFLIRSFKKVNVLNVYKGQRLLCSTETPAGFTGLKTERSVCVLRGT